MKYHEFTKEEYTVIIGDFNFDSPGTNDLSNFFSRMDFTQMVKKATHLDGNILDHFYISKKKSHLVEISHHYVYYSDHDGIMVNLKNEAFP